ncbi:hypothetical protein G3N59_19770 [Paraburkholderia sp. Ac-20340]|uniref:hypothetical protein n=1 Tax=Paraburkholderia sp. Ac-20340 TaxID=2703888 RepID=UPI00197D9291|nr:hypothetical protein [Paraburkholderia sp. Ac-20340]MBN3855616.1 hypothetical protein [Paraburkholderia sp. Ac-20340]
MAAIIRAAMRAGTVAVHVVRLKNAVWQAQISLQSRTFSWRAAARHRCEPLAAPGSLLPIEAGRGRSRHSDALRAFAWRAGGVQVESALTGC